MSRTKAKLADMALEFYTELYKSSNELGSFTAANETESLIRRFFNDAPFSVSAEIQKVKDGTKKNSVTMEAANSKIVPTNLRGNKVEYESTDLTEKDFLASAARLSGANRAADNEHHYEKDAHLKTFQNQGVRTLGQEDLEEVEELKEIEEPNVEITEEELEKQKLLVALNDMEEPEILKHFKNYKAVVQYAKQNFEVEIGKKAEGGLEMFKESVRAQLLKLQNGEEEE